MGVKKINHLSFDRLSALAGTLNFLSNLLLLSSIARAHRLSSRAAALPMAFVSLIIALVATTLVFAACIFTFVQVMESRCM